MPGRSRLKLTGQLGDVMKELAEAALCYCARRRLADGYRPPPRRLEKHDMHVHVPAGAIPKDFPSAGVALVTAMVSLLTGRVVRPDLAMTGEITLRRTACSRSAG